MSGMSYSVDQLDTALTTLRQRWEAARAVWNDAVSQDFERTVWAGIEAQTRAAHQAMAQLAQMIAQAERAVK
jgi:hypothetical protein